jgi:hypothetical protein
MNIDGKGEHREDAPSSEQVAYGVEEFAEKHGLSRRAQSFC